MSRYVGIKGKAWEAVKRWTRRTFKHCYTCPARDLVGVNAQAGHFIPVALAGSNNTLSWDEHCIRLQCSRCNGPGQGMQVQYRANLVKEYGEKFVKNLEQRRYKIDPVKNWPAVIEHFDGL